MLKYDIMDIATDPRSPNEDNLMFILSNFNSNNLKYNQKNDNFNILSLHHKLNISQNLRKLKQMNYTIKFQFDNQNINNKLQG